MQEEHLHDPIRNFASADFTALAQGLSVGQALSQIRRDGVAQQIVYFYVLDETERLVGVVPTRRLLTAPLDSRLSEIMITRVLAIPETATVLEACEMFLLHKFLAFPVVDVERRMKGVVNVNLFTGEVFDMTEKERMDDVFETIGFRVSEVQMASASQAFRLRFPWLVATMAGGICCAVLSSRYETTLAGSIVLAFFLTMVLGLGESVAAQSVTVTVQGLRTKHPDVAWLMRALRKEFATALMLGLACGGCVGLVAWLWRGNGLTASVIGGSISLSIVVACLIGVAVPAILHRFKLDPKIAAGPVSLAVADVFTLFAYFNLAKFVL